MERRFAAHHRRTLFRYRPSVPKHDTKPEMLGYLASVLRDRIIYVPTIEEFNDPWDAAPSVSVDPNMQDEEIVTQLLRHLSSADPAPQTVERIVESFRKKPREERIAQLRDVFSARTRKFAVLCLSNDPTTPLLWSYYAGGHSGYVLEFDAQLNPIAGAVKVTYDDDFPNIDPTSAHPGDLTQNVLFVKGDFWRHEREWRLVLPTTPSQETAEPGFKHVPATPSGKGPPPPGVYIQLPEGAIRSVTLGFRMRDKPRRKIMEFIESAAIKIAVYEETIGTNAFVVGRKLHKRSPVKDTV